MRLRSIPIAIGAAVVLLGLGAAGIASAQEDDGTSDVTTVTTDDPAATDDTVADDTTDTDDTTDGGVTDDGSSTDDGAASDRAGCEDGEGGGGRGPGGGAPGEAPAARAPTSQPQRRDGLALTRRRVWCGDAPHQTLLWARQAGMSFITPPASVSTYSSWSGPTPNPVTITCGRLSDSGATWSFAPRPNMVPAMSANT